jgi:hypothetical protein
MPSSASGRENRTTVLRGVTIGMGFLFLFSAAVQYNDPDPLRWLGVYLLAAALSFLSLRNLLPWWLYAATGVLAIVWAVGIGVGVDASGYRSMFGEFGMASLEVEEAREAVGLVIIGVWMGVLAGRKLPERRTRRR